MTQYRLDVTVMNAYNSTAASALCQSWSVSVVVTLIVVGVKVAYQHQSCVQLTSQTALDWYSHVFINISRGSMAWR